MINTEEKVLIASRLQTLYAEDAEVAQPGRAPDIVGEAEDRVDYAEKA
jgi:hypothetical protein